MLAWPTGTVKEIAGNITVDASGAVSYNFADSLGGWSEAAPPVTIPNTEVKRLSADDTASARVWENRSPPGVISFLGAAFSATESLHRGAISVHAESESA